ncbi:type II 3-dehydroquinate dehydratase [Streptomyces sp. NPDC005811]|uniref:type II 3-dehydroquinate dehydratase n=1 Tax=Streptomyces sp. NPDC005811 TaxID=3154565 RepID=UPI003404B086
MDLKTLRTTDQRWEIAILSGPNTRRRFQPADEFERELRSWGDSLGIAVRHVQSNHEGKLLEYVHAHAGQVDGFLVNPGGLVRVGESLRHVLKDARKPAIELHPSQAELRGESIFAPSVTGIFAGPDRHAVLGALVALSLALDDLDFLHPEGTSEINRSHGNPRSLYG